MKFLLPPFILIGRQCACRRSWSLGNGAGVAYGRVMRQISVSRTLQDETMAAVTEETPQVSEQSNVTAGQAQAQAPRSESQTAHGTTTAIYHDLDDLETRSEPPLIAVSFRSVGIEPSLVKALRVAFPHVQRPTTVQARLIAEILGGRDILLKDDTGSGKSFGLVLGLLCKPRVVLEEKGQDGTKVLRRVITSIFIVPHKDLAYQLSHWTERIVSHLHPQPRLESIVQVLVRDSEKSREKLVEELKEMPPHILICTPQAFLEVYKISKEALQLETLSTVVVDEVDYLVPTVARKDPGKSYRKAYEKAVKKIRTHPGPTREILNIIYARRKEFWENPYSPEEDVEKRYNSVEEWRNDVEAEEEIPQLILSSATLRVHLKDYLFEESGWLNGFNLVKIVAENGVPRVEGDGLVSEEAEEGAEKNTKKRGNIKHSILVVSDTGVENVEGAIEGRSEEREEIREAEEEAEEGGEENRLDEYYDEQYDATPSPFNPATLEAITTAFALDVPSSGLLVIPSSAPVKRAVYELRLMGVNAHVLDLLKNGAHLLSDDGGGGDVRRANPTLLVATLATTRGLDLPGLTHVFVLGIPEGPSVTGRSVDAYLHLAGRVGRFGRVGNVISVVEEAEAAKMVRIFKSIGVKPVLFKQFI